MKTAKFRIQIDFTGVDDEMETHEISVEAQMPEEDANSIDKVEKTLLVLNKEAIRQAVVAYFEELSKKKPKWSKTIEEVLSKEILPLIESMEK